MSFFNIVTTIRCSECGAIQTIVGAHGPGSLSHKPAANNVVSLTIAPHNCAKKRKPVRTIAEARK